MAPPKSNVYETAVYLKAAEQYLTDHERQAVRLLVVDDPMTGLYDHDLEVFVIQWGRNPELEIMYGFSPALEILLLHISPKSDPPDSKMLKDVIKGTLKTGAIIGAKELWDWVKGLL